MLTLLSIIISLSSLFLLFSIVVLIGKLFHKFKNIKLWVVILLGVIGLTVSSIKYWADTRIPVNPGVQQQIVEPPSPVYTREELLAETNKHRDTPLLLDPVLNDTAQRKCEDMVSRDDFNHGDLQSYWVMAGKRKHGIAENLVLTNQSVKKAVDSWVASPTHYANIIETSWGHVGFGICPFRGETLIVQHFSD